MNWKIVNSTQIAGLFRIAAETFTETSQMLRSQKSEVPVTLPKKSRAEARAESSPAKKKTKTAYMMYQDYKMKEIKAKPGGEKLKLPELSSMISHYWAEMDPTEKEIWIEKSNEEKKHSSRSGEMDELMEKSLKKPKTNEEDPKKKSK